MILKSFEYLYHLLSDAKNVLYDTQLLKSQKLNVPVISIGNLSFGGTGKTPFIEFIANQLHEKKIVIVCRSYKASLTQPQKVDVLLSNAAHYFGDEAVLLQKKLPQCYIWSGPSKIKTAQCSLSDKPDIILVDDGFSHRQLQREFDLVLFDSSRIDQSYNRENLTSLKRAHAIVLTKFQNNFYEKTQIFIENILKKFPHLKNSIFFSSIEISISLPTTTPIFAFCGIAQPDSFRQILLKKGFKIIYFKALSDHQNYSINLQKQLFDEFKNLLKTNPDLQIVTTEKDLMKINHTELLKFIHVVGYKIEMATQQKENLLEKIRKSIKS